MPHYYTLDKKSSLKKYLLDSNTKSNEWPEQQWTGEIIINFTEGSVCPEYAKLFWASPDISYFSPDIGLNLTTALRRTFPKFTGYAQRVQRISHTLVCRILWSVGLSAHEFVSALLFEPPRSRSHFPTGVEWSASYLDFALALPSTL